MTKGKTKAQIDVPSPRVHMNQTLESPFGMLNGAQVVVADPSRKQTSMSSSSSSSSSAATSVQQEQSPDRKLQIQRQLKEKKVWDLAKSPFKNLFVKVILLWLSGNQIHIFPIIITVMSLVEPLKSLMEVNKVFEPFARERIPTLLPTLVYILLNLVGLAIAMVKCYWLGFFEGGAYQPVPLPSQISFYIP
jgi:hypothetical protein